MPRCWFGRARFFDQNVVVKQLGRLALHQVCSHFCGRAVADHGFKFGDTVPIAIIIKKATLFIRCQVFGGKGARIGHVAIHARAQGVHVIGEKAFDEDDAVALEGIDLILGDECM